MNIHKRPPSAVTEEAIIFIGPSVGKTEYCIKKIRLFVFLIDIGPRICGPSLNKLQLYIVYSPDDTVLKCTFLYHTKTVCIYHYTCIASATWDILIPCVGIKKG